MRKGCENLGMREKFSVLGDYNLNLPKPDAITV